MILYIRQLCSCGIGTFLYYCVKHSTAEFYSKEGSESAHANKGRSLILLEHCLINTLNPFAVDILYFSSKPPLAQTSNHPSTQGAHCSSTAEEGASLE